MAALVEVDDLGDVGQLREGRLEARVVVARPAVQQQGRLVAHRGAIGHQAGAFDVDEQGHAGFDGDVHGRSR